jgi:hypothetical protein
MKQNVTLNVDIDNAPTLTGVRDVWQRNKGLFNDSYNAKLQSMFDAARNVDIVPVPISLFEALLAVARRLGTTSQDAGLGGILPAWKQQQFIYDLANLETMNWGFGWSVFIDCDGKPHRIVADALKVNVSAAVTNARGDVVDTLQADYILPILVCITGIEDVSRAEAAAKVSDWCRSDIRVMEPFLRRSRNVALSISS